MSKISKRQFLLSAIFVALISVGSSLASAVIPNRASATSGCVAPYRRYYSMTLSGPQESPPNASPGTGSGLVLVDTISQTMQVKVSFSGLAGTTTAAHIHSATTAPYSGTAIVATMTPAFTGFPLGVTSGTMDHTFDMTLDSSYSSSFITANGGSAATAFCALSSGIDEGKAYFNIHTTNYPGGEIRGFLMGYKLFLPIIFR